MLLTPLEAVVGILMNAVSRKFEYQADRFACELQTQLSDEKMADMGDRLARALVALHVENLSTVWVDWLYVYVSCLSIFLRVSRLMCTRTGTRRTTTHTRRSQNACVRWRAPKARWSPRRMRRRKRNSEDVGMCKTQAALSCANTYSGTIY